MPWGFSIFSSPSGNDDDGNSSKGGSGRKSTTQTGTPPRQPRTLEATWNRTRDHLSVPHNWIAPAAAAVLTLGLVTFYQSYLRRIPAIDHIAPNFFRRRSLFGKVTSVGDGDGFHIYHTPGGRLAGWGWLRRVPKDKKKLKGQTVR